MRRPVSTLGRELALERPVAGRVVGLPVLPHPPEDAAPGASDGANCALVVVASGASAGVEVAGPGVVVTAGGGERAPQALVAGPAKGGVLALAGLDGDRGHAAVGGERLGARVAQAGVADLREQAGRGDDRPGIAEER